MVVSFTLFVIAKMPCFSDPPLVIELDPPIVTALDVSPYNMISIVCNVTQPGALILTKEITWKGTSPSGRTQHLNHTGADMNITNVGLEDSSSISMLSVYTTSAGTWRFTCIASLDVPSDPLISLSETATATVKGN